MRTTASRRATTPRGLRCRNPPPLSATFGTVRVSWFETQVVDLDGAAAFYERGLGMSFGRAAIDLQPMALFPDSDEPGRNSGALATGDSDVPSLGSTWVHIAVDGVPSAFEPPVAARGREFSPVTQVSDDLTVAEFADSNGDRVALAAPANG